MAQEIQKKRKIKNEQYKSMLNETIVACCHLPTSTNSDNIRHCHGFVIQTRISGFNNSDKCYS
jgi:hypothetical protein